MTVLKCDHCSKHFGKARSLARHLFQSHNETLPFQCPICPTRFSSKKHMGMHVKKEHSKTGHPCSLCPRTYLTLGQLQSHFKESHNALYQKDEFTDYELNEEEEETGFEATDDALLDVEDVKPVLDPLDI